MKKNPWLSRDLFTTNIYYALATTEAEYLRHMRDMLLANPEGWLGDHPKVAGRTHHTENKKTGEQRIIVCVPIRPKRPIWDTVGILTHEGMHVWRAMREDIGETSPSSEFEAYAIQTIVGHLMWAYDRAATAAARKQARAKAPK